MGRANPSPLVIFGNPKNPAHSESFAWQEVESLVRQVLKSGRLDEREHHKLDAVLQIAKGMLAQVRAGVHKNPRKLSGPIVMSHNVQAVAYVHEKDGGQYVHAFGDVELNEDDLNKGWLDLGSLKQQTHIDMIAYPDGTVTLIGTKGQPLAALFD